MKALNGEPVFVRPGTSDLTNAADYMVLGLHFPAPEIAAKNLRADCRDRQQHRRGADRPCFCLPGGRASGRRARSRQPGRREMNVARFGDRVKLIRAGIWDENCMLVVDEGYGRRARAGGPPRGARRPRRRRARARADDRQRALRTLARRRADRLPPREHRGLRAARVRRGRRLAVTRQVAPRRAPPLLRLRSPASASRQLEALGYRAWLAPPPAPAGKWVFAVRD